MKIFSAIVFLWLVIPALGQSPSITINASVDKIREQILAEAAKNKYEVKENLPDKLIIQGKSLKRGGFKYGLVYARVGPIYDQRITYHFKPEGSAVIVDGVAELVVDKDLVAYEKGTRDLKKQLAEIKKKVEK